jgi:alpha-L-glutamate ligase-like protein
MNYFEKILGINERNLSLIYEYNPLRYYAMADDKLLTKKILEEAGISTPKLLHSYKYFFELNRLKEDLWNRADFVIKPSHGLQGGGIVVFDRFSNGHWLTASEKPYSAGDLFEHATDILHGVYSLDNTNDAVMIEEKIKLDAFFRKITYKGVPDIRVIVFQRRPVMAMLRIPTKCSEGRANLHAGGIGVGLDLISGLTTCAKIKKDYIEIHPDTGVRLIGLRIPHWADILDIAQRIQKYIPLGYLGIDFVLDERYGPQILELNVRPGLEIQNVNNKGLKTFLNGF